MIITPTVDGPDHTLFYKKYPIRMLSISGVPWLSLRDIGDALSLNQDGLDLVNEPAFPAFAKMTASEEADPDIPGEPEDQVVLSPVGVWFLTALLSEPKRGEDLAAWAKRETKRLCPEPIKGDPAVFLTVLDNGGQKKLPPYPWRYSGRRSEWLDLRESDEWAFRDYPELIRSRRERRQKLAA